MKNLSYRFFSTPVPGKGGKTTNFEISEWMFKREKDEYMFKREKEEF